MITKLIAGPLIGGIIGLITNGIAIRMLFRPIKPIYLFGVKLPFTPGIIPKEKPRIAHSLGNVVANHLLTEETLKKGLTSAEIDEKINAALDQFFEDHRNSELTVRELIFSVTGDEKGLVVLESAEEKIVSLSYQKMLTMNLGPVLSEIAATEIEENLKNSMFAMFVSDSLIETARQKISEIIDKLIRERGEEVVQNIVEKETAELLNLKCSDIVINNQEKLPELKEKFLLAYHRVVEKHSHSIVRSINLGKLVEDQINAFDILTFEKLLLDIMDKELKAIIWLGGFLGAIMGIILSLI